MELICTRQQILVPVVREWAVMLRTTVLALECLVRQMVVLAMELRAARVSRANILRSHFNDYRRPLVPTSGLFTFYGLRMGQHVSA